MMLVVEVLKGGGNLAITDFYDQIEKSKSLMSKAVDRLLKNGSVFRSGSGKKGNPYKYSSFPPSDTYAGETRGNPKQQISQRKRKKNSPRAILTKIKTLGEELGRLFLSRKVTKNTVKKKLHFRPRFIPRGLAGRRALHPGRAVRDSGRRRLRGSP